MADLHHDRDTEFGAARVVGIVDRCIWRLSEPVRIKVGADKSELLDSAIKLLQPGYAAGWIDAGEAGKPVRILLYGSMYFLVGNFSRAAEAQVAATHGNQQGALDPGAVHFLDVLLKRQASPIALLNSHLVTEIFIGGSTALGNDLGRVHIDDNVHGTKPESGIGGGEGIGGCRHGRALIRGFRQRSVLRPDDVISLQSRRPERIDVRQAVAAI